VRDAARLTRTPDDDPTGEPVDDRTEVGRRRVDAPDGSGRSMARWFRLAVLVSLVPVVSAGVRDALRGWIPTHDGAAMSLKAEQVFSHHPPMIGMFALASTWAGRVIHMPGPIELYLLAVPVHLFGPGGGVLLGMVLLNGSALLVTAWLLRRRVGYGPALVGVLGLTVLCWSLGSEALIDPIPRAIGLLPLTTLFVGAWSAADGDDVGLPVVALVATYLLQTFLGLLVIVPALVVTTVVWSAVHAWRARRAVPGRVRRWLAWFAGSTLAALVCWVPPLYQQITSNPGNLSALAKSSGSHAAASPSWGRSIATVVSVVAIPPAWLPPSYARPPLGRIDGSGVSALVVGFGLVLLGCFALAARSALRRRDHLVGSALGITAVALLAGVATVERSNLDGGHVAIYYVRFLWSMGWLTWVVLLVALLRARCERPRARHARRHTPPAWSARLVGVAPQALLAATVLCAAAAVPTRWGDASTQAWTIEPGRDLVDVVHRTVATDRTPVYLERKVGTGPFVFDPLVAGALAREGVPFYVGDALRIHQYGLQTGLGSYTPPRRLVLTSDIHATDLGTRIYAFDGLSPDLAHRLAKVRRRLRNGRAAHFRIDRSALARIEGSKDLGPVDAATLRRVVALVADPPQQQPDWYLSSDDMAWGLTRMGASTGGDAPPLIRVDGADEDAVRGWATLRVTQLDRRFALYLGPNPG
jgi:hypothetical protein